MNGMTDFDISQILASFYRRKGLIICVSIVVFLLTAYTAAILPNVYRSSSLILVSPQRVPSSFVTSTITTDLGERMQSIIQEILSRTQLEKIVREFDLYPSTNSSFLEERIEKLRKAIKVEFRRNNVFQLSFESDNPEKAKQITGRIASLFIEQNLQVREQQAMGTKSFMTAEADRLRKELEDSGSIFQSTSDTEVLLKAYHAWGRDCVKRFVGMFAFCLWERDSGRLLLARDRLGKKPLYSAHVPEGGLVFSSELKALLASGLVSDQLCSEALIDYLQLIHPDNDKDPRQEQVAKIARRLKGLAREMKVPVMCLAQLNRHYEDWIGHYTLSPVLIVDTDACNVVEEEAELADVADRVQRKLEATRGFALPL